MQNNNYQSDYQHHIKIIALSLMCLSTIFSLQGYAIIQAEQYNVMQWLVVLSIESGTVNFQWYSSCETVSFNLRSHLNNRPIIQQWSTGNQSWCLSFKRISRYSQNIKQTTFGLLADKHTYVDWQESNKKVS